MDDSEPEYLLKQAERCRRLARATLDQRTRSTLLGMAEEYEQRADQVRVPSEPLHPLPNASS
jgi:hypothetical protein